MTLVSFCLGRYPVPLLQLLCIFGKAPGLPLETTWTGAMESAALRIRLPRICLACLVGGCLSTAGAALSILLGAPGAMITASAFCFSLLTPLSGKRFV